MTTLLKLLEHGQSYWLDDLTRGLIGSGELKRMVGEEGLRGLTSNPKTFSDAISGSADYDEQIARAVEAGRSTSELYEDLVTTDIRDACDILRPVYDESGGRDGFASLEVSPRLARDTDASLAEARRLFKMVDRPNLFIKIPGTREGVPAIEELLFDGINVNITLLFSVASYEAVAEAYMRALERRVEAKRPVDRIASVASFFLSRIDILVDELLGHRASGREPDPRLLRGRTAVANAKLAYDCFRRILDSGRWKALEKHGAQPQRMLWASTSTKNPDYRDVMYVEPLIGPHTVNTLPRKTIAAFADHGEVADTVTEKLEDARRVMADLERLGIDFAQVTAQLENEGIQKFIEPFDSLLAGLEEKRRHFAARRDAQMVSDMALRLRRMSIEMTTAAGSGHPTTCMSAAEIVAALFFREMRWDPSDPRARNVDQFVLSKGHAAPILWAALSLAGAIHDDPLSLRRIDSDLEGHPTPNSPWVKVATGSLGQGLSAAAGMALANRLDGIDGRIYCLLGDGECSEGSVWEATQFASLNKLANLVAIVDLNGIAQSGAAPYRHDADVFARRFAAFGWRTLVIDGHDPAAVMEALGEAGEGGRPLAIVARTEKGKGVSFLEGMQGWHGKPLSEDEAKRALAELGEPAGRPAKVEARRTGDYAPPAPTQPPAIEVSRDQDKPAATRDGYGSALAKLGAAMPEIVVIDGDVGDSTRAKEFAQKFPDRFFQGYIAEQNMIGVALGLAVSDKLPFAASFAAFLTRAYDFIRMAGHSRVPHLVICGSHAGVSIGEDGPSQMGLEDIAMFRALLGSTVLHPSDPVSAERVTELAARGEGIVYVRTARAKTPVIYTNDEAFAIGGSKVLRRSDKDVATVVAAGVTVHEALAAYEELQKRKLAVRVIDAYSIKPVDGETLVRAARETGHLITVEDHFAAGGLGEAVRSAVGNLAPVRQLAVTGYPRSGPPEALLDRHGISRRAIAEAVLEVAAPSRG